MNQTSMSTGDAILAVVATAIFSPIVCFMLYVMWRGIRELKKGMRRIEVVDWIKKDSEVQRTITELITAKVREDYLLQQAIADQQKKSVTSMTRREA